MKYFYAFMVWATEMELALARLYGNKQHTIQLTQDLNKWRRVRDLHEINRRFA